MRPTAWTRRGRTPVGTTVAAGWIAIAFGAAHMIVAPLASRTTWSQVRAEGWWSTATLAKPTTLAEAQRSEAFGTTPGSFGAPVSALGCHIVWSPRRRVPRWLGRIVLAWGLPFITVLPASPGWAIPLISGLLVAGDHGDPEKLVSRQGRADEPYCWRN